MNTQVTQDKLPPKGLVRIFACGGCGVNIASALEEFRDQQEIGMAEVDIIYVDTSRSNLKQNLPQEKIYLLDGADGSGKERKHNSAAILKHAKEILQLHKPGYLNIVLSSASGGSGSVLAPVLANEMLAADNLVIGITIGVSDTGVEIKNTLDTLRSYEGVSAAQNKPVMMAYFENNRKTMPSAVDADVHRLLTAICVLFSRENTGLDTRDMYNFLNFERVTSYPAHMASLSLAEGVLSEESGEGVIAIASAVISNDDRGIEFAPPYGCYGILPAKTSPTLTNLPPIHLVAKAFSFNEQAHRLNAMLDEMKREAEARTASSALTTNSGGTGGFLVL